MGWRRAVGNTARELHMSLQFRAPGIEQYLDTRPMNLAGAFTSGYGQAQNRRALDMRQQAMEQAAVEREQARLEAAQMRYGPDLVIGPDGGVDFGASEAARWQRAQSMADAQRAAELQDYEMRRQVDLELAREKAIMEEMFRPEPTPPAPRPPDRPFEGTRETPGGKQSGKFATQAELDKWMQAGGGQQAFGLDEWQRARNVIDAAEGDVTVKVNPLSGEVEIGTPEWYMPWRGLNKEQARKRLEELRAMRGQGGAPAPAAATGTNRPIRDVTYPALRMQVPLGY